LFSLEVERLAAAHAAWADNVLEAKARVFSSEFVRLVLLKIRHFQRALGL
jgi:hypothetical protein